MSFLNRLRRRNIFRVATAYLAGAWLLVEITETHFPIYGLSDALVRLVVTLLAIGFPLALALSGVFELTFARLRLEMHIDESTAPRQASRLNRIGKKGACLSGKIRTNVNW